MVIFVMIVNYIKRKVGPSNDFKIKEISINNLKVTLFFNEVLTDTSAIDNFILKKLLVLKKSNFKNLNNYLPTTNIIKINLTDIFNYVNKGFLIIISKRIYAVEVKAKLDRGINTIESELSTSGPKDSFS